MSAQSILKRLYDDEQWIDAQADAIALIEKQAAYIAALEAVAEAARLYAAKSTIKNCDALTLELSKLDALRKAQE